MCMILQMCVHQKNESQDAMVRGEECLVFSFHVKETIKKMKGTDVQFFVHKRTFSYSQSTFFSSQYTCPL